MSAISNILLAKYCPSSAQPQEPSMIAVHAVAMAKIRVLNILGALFHLKPLQMEAGTLT